MTASRPYSEQPRWEMYGDVTVAGGTLVLLLGLTVPWWPAIRSGSAVLLAGVVLRTATKAVWEP